MKNIVFLIICCLVCSCQKKSANKLPQSDDFEVLSGKDTSTWHYVQTREDFEHLNLFKTIYQLKKGLLAVQEETYRIPQVVHFIWIGPNPFPRASVENVRTWMAKHPHWTFYFWTDRDRPVPCPRMQIRQIRELNFLKLKHCFQTSDNYGEKSDVLRYEILYQEGGVYVDHDVACFKEFDLLNKTYDFYCGIDMPYKSSLPSCIFPTNNLIGVKAHHPIIKTCMETLAEKWDQLAQDYPGTGREEILNRTLHRSFMYFGEAVKCNSQRDNNRDIVFPAYYFDAPSDALALYARHQYAGAWHETKTPFEKSVSHRLMYISKKSNLILLIVGGMSTLNIAALVAVFLMLRKRKT